MTEVFVRVNLGKSGRVQFIVDGGYFTTKDLGELFDYEKIYLENEAYLNSSHKGLFKKPLIKDKLIKRIFVGADLHLVTDYEKIYKKISWKDSGRNKWLNCKRDSIKQLLKVKL